MGAAMISLLKAFVGEVRNRNKFPIALMPAFKSNKRDLFDLWRKIRNAGQLYN